MWGAWDIGKALLFLLLLTPLSASQEIVVEPPLGTGQGFDDRDALVIRTEPVWLLDLTNPQLQSLFQRRGGLLGFS